LWARRRGDLAAPCDVVNVGAGFRLTCSAESDPNPMYQPTSWGLTLESVDGSSMTGWVWYYRWVSRHDTIGSWETFSQFFAGNRDL
jgi:hypothetical protein